MSRRASAPGAPQPPAGPTLASATPPGLRREESASLRHTPSNQTPTISSQIRPDRKPIPPSTAPRRVYTDHEDRSPAIIPGLPLDGGRVLFTTASATQPGFLTAVVEACCADEPTAHEDTLNRCQCIFDRIRVDHIV